MPRLLAGQCSARELVQRFDFLHSYFRDSAVAARYFVTFIENHDSGAWDISRLLHHDRDERLAIIAATYLLTSVGIPCWYYGTEQGFHGGGDGKEGTDQFIREAMFGGTWGGHDSSGAHFFNPRHPIYCAIAQLARVRREQPALRYGRQYIREISEDGEHFGYPDGSDYTLAYSRILDNEEIVIALNASKQARGDAITVDRTLSPSGTKLCDALGRETLRVAVASNGRAYVRVPLEGRMAAILVNRAAT